MIRTLWFVLSLLAGLTPMSAVAPAQALPRYLGSKDPVNENPIANLSSDDSWQRSELSGIIAGEAKRPIVARGVTGEEETQLLEERSPNHPWSIDFLIGTMTGLRVQRFLDSDQCFGWMGEVFVGVQFFAPAAGAGVRYGLNLWVGKYNALSISPGVNFYYVENFPFGFFSSFDKPTASCQFLTVDVDILWKHVLSESVSGEFGLKIGVGDVLEVKGEILPVFCLFAGVRF